MNEKSDQTGSQSTAQGSATYDQAAVESRETVVAGAATQGTGGTNQSVNARVRHILVGTEQQSPIWTFALLGGCYSVVMLWILLGGLTAGNWLFPGFCFVVGIPLLWLDAHGTIEAGRLPVETPLFAVLGVYALYPGAVPAYLAYRLYDVDA